MRDESKFLFQHRYITNQYKDSFGITSGNTYGTKPSMRTQTAAVEQLWEDSLSEPELACCVPLSKSSLVLKPYLNIL